LCAPAAELMKQRTYLFLQGPATPFFARLARALREQGHAIQRINFCGGDVLYWRGLPAWNFREDTDALAAFIDEKFARHAITDVVLFGEQRPVHQIAIEVARKRGATLRIFEEGYVRPNWITLECGGTNGNSSLPHDPSWYRDRAGLIPDYGDGTPLGPAFRARAWYDIWYRIANAILYGWFHRYRSHRPVNAALEYLGWIRRFPMLPLRRRAANRITHRLTSDGTPYFVLPLQLGSDSQVSVHSDVGNLGMLMLTVMKSFAAHAPADIRLIVKNHPLDTALVDYAAETRRIARRLGIESRVVFLDSAHLPTLLNHCLGVVTINSTVGMQALYHGAPVIALGRAIYDMEGLTFQGPLDDFWTRAQLPDRRLFQAFRNAVIHLTQVNGGFYNDRGMALAVENSLPRMLNGLPEPLGGHAADSTGAQAGRA
jgi:capsular polysaccharide export protein